MRVLFVNTVDKNGSTGKIIRQLGEEIIQSGGEYMVAFGRGKETDERSYRIGNDFDCYLHAAISRITDRGGFYSKRATRKFVKWIKAYNPDIIHLHNLHGYYLNFEILFNYLKNDFSGRIVWTLHDCFAFTGHCTHYTYENCSKWKSGCFNCKQKREYPKSWILDNSRNNYLKKKSIFTGVPNLTVVTVSDWLKNEAKLSFLQEYRIDTIHNGIDITRFSPTPSDIKEKLNIKDKYVYLAVSDGWTERKGYDELIKFSQRIDDESVIVMIGLNDKQLKQLPRNIVGMKRTWNQDELIKLYSAADVFINPSKEETFGLVTAEAMACGTPAVVYNATACPEVVGDDASGKILDKNIAEHDQEDIKLCKTLFSSNCRERVVSLFSLERMRREYINLYLEGNKQ